MGEKPSLLLGNKSWLMRQQVLVLGSVWLTRKWIITEQHASCNSKVKEPVNI
jgi:hypothetical protein